MGSGPYVEFFQASNDQWYWRLRSANSQIVAIGGEGYTRKEDAVRAWGTARSLAMNATVVED